MTVEERREEINKLGSLKKLVDAIEFTNSINKKKAIILANKEDKLFIKTLLFLVSDKKTGISKNNIGKKIYYEKGKKTISQWENLMDYLDENNTSTDESIAIVQRFLFLYPKRIEPYLMRLVTKDFILNIGEKTIREII